MRNSESTDESTSDDDFAKLMERYQELVDSQRFDDAAELVCEIFPASEEWSNLNPNPALCLTNAANEREENADWNGAEAFYSRILAIPNLEPMNEFKALSDLAGLCHLLNRDSDALGYAQRATAAARRSNVSIVLVMALKEESLSQIRCGRLKEAGNSVTEVFSILEGNEMFKQFRASALVLRASCAVRGGQLGEADRDLDEAFALLRPLSRMEFHCDLARLWTVRASLHVARGNHQEAVRAWHEAVTISKHVASISHAESVYTNVAIADRLTGLASALLACNRNEDAASAIAERNEILFAAGVPNRNSP